MGFGYAKYRINAKVVFAASNLSSIHYLTFCTIVCSNYWQESIINPPPPKQRFNWFVPTVAATVARKVTTAYRGIFTISVAKRDCNQESIMTHQAPITARLEFPSSTNNSKNLSSHQASIIIKLEFTSSFCQSIPVLRCLRIYREEGVGFLPIMSMSTLYSSHKKDYLPDLVN